MYINILKKNIEVEYPIKVGSSDKRCDIVIFNDDIKSQDNILWIIETKKKDEKEGVEQLWSYMLRRLRLDLERGLMAITFCITTKILSIQINMSNFLIFPNTKRVSFDWKVQKKDLVRCTDLKGVFKRCNNYFFSNE